MTRGMPETTLDGIRDVKLYQNRNGYRFSVDALILYSFVNVKYAERIVDLGAGSGVIGLLLARKYEDAEIVLLELQKSLCALATKNIELNGLGGRVSAVLADYREIRSTLIPMSCEVVVSNPPFRKVKSGRLSIEEERAVARHEIRMELPDLVDAASYLLKARGRFFMIYHPNRLLELSDVLRSKRLEPKRIRFVYNDILSTSKIVLVESVKEGRPGVTIEKPLFLYDGDGAYTAEVKKMYGK